MAGAGSLGSGDYPVYAFKVALHFLALFMKLCQFESAATHYRSKLGKRNVQCGSESSRRDLNRLYR